jgi:uncharacterized protein YceH (UPF0502 family)
MQELPPRPGDKPARWQPVPALERRVLGVLVEKAKTTPDAYPMTVNALVTGCNQKNNRSPVMDVRPEDVEEALERLRELGAVAEVQGGGRVPKYRHYLYEWLGVDKVELAVMAELLLRGAQTEGELRGRAARMEPIADLPALRPILTGLESKGLIVPLSPAGRGRALTHALYEPPELERLKAHYGAAADYAGDAAESPGRPQASGASRGEGGWREEIARLEGDLAALRQEVAELRAAYEAAVAQPPG